MILYRTIAFFALGMLGEHCSRDQTFKSRGAYTDALCLSFSPRTEKHESDETSLFAETYLDNSSFSLRYSSLSTFASESFLQRGKEAVCADAEYICEDIKAGGLQHTSQSARQRQECGAHSH
jgi:hypothetical protein